MTIQQLADAYVGHPEEIDEDSVITAKREAFKAGAETLLKEIERYIYNSCSICGLDTIHDIHKFKGE